MKIALYCIFMIACIDSAYGQAKVIAQVSNFESNKGVLRACIFDNASAFNGESRSPVKCTTVTVANKRSEIVFDNLASGNYAIFLFHDVNNNNKMDKNFLGIPKEGYGASNNKLPFAAAPSYNDNKFTLGKSDIKQMNIKLRNL